MSNVCQWFSLVKVMKRESEIALLLLSIISFQAFKNDMMMLTFLEGSDH